jgi:hypothetical protein
MTDRPFFLAHSKFGFIINRSTQGAGLEEEKIINTLSPVNRNLRKMGVEFRKLGKSKNKGFKKVTC